MATTKATVPNQIKLVAGIDGPYAKAGTNFHDSPRAVAKYRAFEWTQGYDIREADTAAVDVVLVCATQPTCSFRVILQQRMDQGKPYFEVAANPSISHSHAPPYRPLDLEQENARRALLPKGDASLSHPQLVPVAVAVAPPPPPPSYSPAQAHPHSYSCPNPPLNALSTPPHPPATFLDFMLDLNPEFEKYSHLIPEWGFDAVTLEQLVSEHSDVALECLEKEVSLPEFTRYELINGFKALVERKREMQRVNQGGDEWYQINRDPVGVREKVMRMIDEAEDRQGLTH